MARTSLAACMVASHAINRPWALPSRRNLLPGGFHTPPPERCWPAISLCYDAPLSHTAHALQHATCMGDGQEAGPLAG